MIFFDEQVNAHVGKIGNVVLFPNFTENSYTLLFRLQSPSFCKLYKHSIIRFKYYQKKSFAYRRCRLSFLFIAIEGVEVDFAVCSKVNNAKMV